MSGSQMEEPRAEHENFSRQLAPLRHDLAISELVMIGRLSSFSLPDLIWS